MSYKICIVVCIFSCLFCVACKPKETTITTPIETQKDSSPDSIIKPLKKADTSFKNNPQDDSLYNIIGSLTEVKDFIKKTNSKKSDKKVNIIINQRPDKVFPYYWLQVGVSDQYRFQPVYNFYINDSNLQVNYYDTSTDSIITLKKWRETRGW